MPSILFVFTSADKGLGGSPTGWYLPEAAHPYYVLAPHFDIDFAAPAGPVPPLDDRSVKSFAEDPDSIRFLTDEIVKAKFANTKKLTEVNEKDYDAIFYPGGFGPVIDLSSDPVNAKLVSQFWQAGKVTAAVCHGPAALVGAVDASGKSIFAGRAFTGFSNAEEDMTGMAKELPFLLEDKITTLGGKYEKTDPWQPKLVVDGKLITGQNPLSSTLVGQAILKAFQ